MCEISIEKVPLVVDLDGTLINTDMLHESALQLARNSPLQVLKMPVWLLDGKAVLKQSLSARSEFDVRLLPYNNAFICWLKKQHEDGRKLILCTASDHSIANDIAQHLGFFDEVLASDGRTNLAGPNKARLLVERFGQRGFDYAGNSKADLPVWMHASKAIVVNAPIGLSEKASEYCEVEETFEAGSIGLPQLARVMRVHQWLKNALLFVPLIASHQLGNFDALIMLLMAFFAFSFCASAVYVVNDLMDLESDRQHPRKRERPFAAGAVPVWMGVVLAPLLVCLSAIFALNVSSDFQIWLTIYFIVTCVYSWVLKRLVLVDCITLAILYTLRIVAGAAAIGQPLSFWLLAFSVFLFLSLAFVKRYAELQLQQIHNVNKVHGRGYFTTDAGLVQVLGIAAAYSATLVLSLYLNSEAVSKLYLFPEMVWGAIPIITFWVSWVWLKAHRGEMTDDPLVFAVKDKASLGAGVLFSIVLLLGAMGI